MLSTKILSPKVHKLVNRWLSAIAAPEGNLIQVYADMVAIHPVASAANELRLLLILSKIKNYSHPDELIQDEVRQSIKNMQGTWKHVLLNMLTYLPFGRSFSEYSYKIKNKKADLNIIQTLDPRYYVFEGTYGNIERVHYMGTNDIYIPYEDGIHLINQPYIALGNDPYGIPICRKAYNYCELWKIIMAQISIATKRQATKLLIAKTNTANNNVTMPDPATGGAIKDEFGNEKLFNQSYVLQKQLEEVENNSFVVIDIEDEIQAIAHETDGSFFINILNYLEAMIFLSWLVPKTITSTGGSTSGDSNLNEGHQEILSLINVSEAEILGESIVEQIIKPMIIFNHGEMAEYGSFPVVDDEELGDIASILKAVADIIEKGVLDENELAVINRVRNLSGIAEYSHSQFDEYLKNKLAKPTPSVVQDSQKKTFLKAKEENSDTPTFRWNKESQRYHYTSGDKKGRFVSYNQTIQIVEASIAQEKIKGESITDDLINKKITVSVWESRIAQNLRNLSVYQYAVGVGGLKQMTWQDNSLITGQLNFQFQKLRAFSNDILSGQMSEAQIRARLALYYNDTRGLFELGRSHGHKTNGYIWEKREITPGENCVSCLGYANAGWVIIGTLPNIGDRCECMSNCNCLFRYSKQLARPN